MKKVFKLFLFILFICFFSNVEAGSYNGRLYELYHPNSGFSVFAEESMGYMDYNSWMVKSTIDNRVYYCIDPAIPLEGASTNSHSVITGKNNIISGSKLTDAKYKKVQLLAYYGYGYKDSKYNHTSKKWYGITQVMIWRVMRPDLTWTFKSSRNATPNSSLFKSEVSEMNKLVSNHNVVPSFKGKNIKVINGSTIELKDTNGVLGNYVIDTSLKNVSVSKSGNTLKITGKVNGKENIKFKLNSRESKPFALFKSTSYQDIIAMGNPDNSTFSFSVTVSGGTINLEKFDKEDRKVLLKDAIYEVYDVNDVLVGQIKTNELGRGSIKLDYGKYKIKEVKAPVGYNLNPEVYEIELTEDKNVVNIEAFDEIIRGKVSLKKKRGSDLEGYALEENAEFEVFNKEGVLVTSVKTDSRGEANFILPYGKYTIKQTKGSFGYVFVKDFLVDIDSYETYYYELVNKKLSSLVFKKVDKDTGKVLSGAHIELYDSSDLLVSSGVTNKEGIIRFDNLEIGNYYIVEKDAPKYYKLDSNRIDVYVDDNGKVIEKIMENERNRGTILFKKTDNSGSKYLKDAFIDIYFLDTNELVFSGKTDNMGLVKIDNLFAGKYCIYERKAPKGYVLNEKPLCVEIENGNQVVEVTMKNDKEIKVPDTFLNKDYSLVFFGFILILVGVVIINVKNNKF